MTGVFALDYLKAPTWFKIAKVARYVRLYGPRRTWMKVLAQIHMRRQYKGASVLHKHANGAGHVGLIGCGSFAFSTIGYYLKRNFGSVLRSAMDVDQGRACSLGAAYGAGHCTTSSMDLIDDPGIDLVYIASNHASHAEYAIEALGRGKTVHIEKPHVVSIDQLIRLCSAMMRSIGKVALGFNRPGSPLGVEIQAALFSQDGPAMLNWFVAGHEIPSDHWYFKPEEGGRVLGNLCHWTDFVYQMIPSGARYPIRIVPTRSDKADCDIAVTYCFGDGSIAVISFSAKGHTFEGVRERFAAHRGNVLISMDDFQSARIETGARIRRLSTLFRNHGHEQNIVNSYRLVRPSPFAGKPCSTRYVWETGELVLRTREALEHNREIIVQGFEESAQKLGIGDQLAAKRQ